MYTLLSAIVILALCFVGNILWRVQTIKVTAVDDRTSKLKAKPQLDTMIEAVGKIGQVDAAKQMINVRGIQFHIAEKTN